MIIGKYNYSEGNQYVKTCATCKKALLIPLWKRCEACDKEYNRQSRERYVKAQIKKLGLRGYRKKRRDIMRKIRAKKKKWY